MKKYFLLGLVFTVLSFSCSEQRDQDPFKTFSIYGRWKCVSRDNRGFQKFLPYQGDVIEKEILIIEKHKMYYTNITFIDSCTYYTLQANKLDTNQLAWWGTSFYYRYKPVDLSKMIEFDQVDINGDPSCYNDCAHLFLKQDTLINICGGYTLFFKKIE